MVPGGIHLLTTAIAMGREAAARELVQFKLPTYWGCFGRTGRVPARRSVGQGGSAVGVDKEITHVSIKWKPAPSSCSNQNRRSWLQRWPCGRTVSSPRDPESCFPVFFAVAAAACGGETVTAGKGYKLGF